jgi:hypothetical protein
VGEKGKVVEIGKAGEIGKVWGKREGRRNREDKWK